MLILAVRRGGLAGGGDMMPAIDFGGLEDSWKWLGWIAVLSSQMYLFGKDARLFILSFL